MPTAEYSHRHTKLHRASGINKIMSSDSEKDNESSKEEKTDTSVDPAKVHSANSWESADLGDDERKKKFLKLMGASKKEHHGRFVIGNQEPVHIHSREKTETEKVNKQLEDQYKHSQDHKITRWHHTGLGFSGEEKKSVDERKPEEGDNSNSSEAKNNQSGDVSEDKGRHSDAPKDSQTENFERKRESTESKEKDSSAPKKPKMMMNFVKSSDSL